MNSVVHECKALTQDDIEFIERLESGLGIMADLSRADVLLCCRCAPGRATVIAQAQPHSILPIHDELIVGQEFTAIDEPAVMRAFGDGRRNLMEVQRSVHIESSPVHQAPIVQEIFPLRSRDGRVFAVLAIETNLIERERHHRRSKVFQSALRKVQHSIMAGQLEGCSGLTPFGEHDGIVVLDSQYHIQYVSGIATSLYRKLGYAGSLLKWHLDDLELDDHTYTYAAMEQKRCYEAEVEVGDLVWVKKAIPLFVHRSPLRRKLSRSKQPWQLAGVLVAIRNETEARRREEELQVKAAMIQEIHHRVKNNMQTIASLLRLQSRRSDSEKVQRALQEGINRILSVAVIHEFLAHQEARVINIRDVSQRILGQFREAVLDGEAGIRLELSGPNIYLPTQPATVCALVINELLQNALEHGYVRQDGGTVTVKLQDDGERVSISVEDDGVGLPEGFDLAQTSSLGLQIVRTLAEGDLKGSFELCSRDKGASAVVTFPKQNNK